MRKIRHASLGVLALFLISCTVPGGIYKGYEGPDKDVKELSVLDWTNSESEVTHIDGKTVQEKSPLLTGVEITIAHLPAGAHTITIQHNWKEIYNNNWDRRNLDLRADPRICDAPQHTLRNYLGANV